MQLGPIVGIVIAIVAVLFAMQNIAPVTATAGFWSVEGPLALDLLVTLGLGALLAGLLPSPAMIRRQWNVAREPASAAEQPAKEKSYVGLRALMGGDEGKTTP